jgi:hypothetical protein
VTTRPALPRYGRGVRRRLAVLALACLALPALAAAADNDPQRRISAADERKAASIVLKRTDFVTGWSRTTTPSTGDDFDCPYFRPDGSDLTLTGDAKSEFEAGGGIPSILSYADVYATAKDAAAAWSRTIRPALPRCLGDMFRREALQPGMTISNVTHGTLAFPKLAPRTAAFRLGLTMTVTRNGQSASVPLAFHIVVVGSGRAEAGLIAFAPKPGLAAADLRSFATLLARRMKAAGF